LLIYKNSLAGLIFLNYLLKIHLITGIELKTLI